MKLQNVENYVCLSEAVEQNWLTFLCIYTCQTNIAKNFLCNKIINKINMFKIWGGCIFLKCSVVTKHSYSHFLLLKPFSKNYV